MQGKVTSPLDDFPLLKFGIEGVPEASDDELILYLIIQPINYLEWEVRIHAFYLKSLDFSMRQRSLKIKYKKNQLT